MFTTLIVQPIFNLLVLIYALIPGHNFGLAVILFTVAVRMLMWPLIKKQLHQTKKMRALQPELKKINKSTKDKKQRSLLMMELYRERGINPFAPLGPLLIQLPIFFGLYLGLQRVVNDPKEVVNFAYPSIANLPWMQQLATDIKQFDETLFSVVDLTKAAVGPEGFYFPAFLIVLASVVIQFFQAKQLIPVDEDARSLRTILKEAGEGKEADQSELNAAIGRSTKYLLPAMVFIFTITIAPALSLYWLVSGLVAYIQQSIVLGKDEEEMEAIAEETSLKRKKNPKSNKDVKDTEAALEGELIAPPKQPKPKAKKAAKRKKRKR
jgi:YidC/Oxa1 family membrane protein insertase